MLLQKSWCSVVVRAEIVLFVMMEFIGKLSLSGHELVRLVSQVSELLVFNARGFSDDHKLRKGVSEVVERLDPDVIGADLPRVRRNLRLQVITSELERGKIKRSLEDLEEWFEERLRWLHSHKLLVGSSIKVDHAAAALGFDAVIAKLVFIEMSEVGVLDRADNLIQLGPFLAQIEDSAAAISACVEDLDDERCQ